MLASSWLLSACSPNSNEAFISCLESSNDHLIRNTSQQHYAFKSMASESKRLKVGLEYSEDIQVELVSFLEQIQQANTPAAIQGCYETYYSKLVEIANALKIDGFELKRFDTFKSVEVQQVVLMNSALLKTIDLRNELLTNVGAPISCQFSSKAVLDTVVQSNGDVRVELVSVTANFLESGYILMVDSVLRNGELIDLNPIQEEVMPKALLKFDSLPPGNYRLVLSVGNRSEYHLNSSDLKGDLVRPIEFVVD